MKHYLYLTFFLILPLCCGAQYVHELSLGYGYGATGRVLYGNNERPLLHQKGGSRFDSVLVLNTFATSNIVRRGTLERTGLFVAAYKKQTKLPWLEVGVGLSWVRAHAYALVNAFYKHPGDRTGYFIRNCISLVPEVNITYHPGKLVTIYGTYGLGICFAREKLTSDATGGSVVESDLYGNFQLSPLGIRVGRRWSGFAEVGYGYKGVLTAGAVYAF